MPSNISNNTIYEIIRTQSLNNPESPSILAVDRESLTYNKLEKQVEYTVDYLRSCGIKRQDRVAVMMPNGPEMASSFLGISCTSICAPLNPLLKHDEIQFYLSDMEARAIITTTSYEQTVAKITEELGIHLIIATPNQRKAGIYTLQGGQDQKTPQGDYSQPDDVALILHTSGTTARPKIVPLTHENLSTSAKNIATSLNLTREDRCLNIMPLFHIHGLIGAFLSSMAAGSQIICSPGFQSKDFYPWLEMGKPTWYTAVPTMHQAIYQEGNQRGEHPKHSLRFIRSCSSALSPRLMSELESLFNVPVVEAYGMTEASHQIAVNPLPPHPRKPSSVGLASGVNVAIMDEEGKILPPKDIGEIVLKGPTVTKGYEKNPEANKKSFHDGWFRTGDQGYIDNDGYIFIKDRIKEIINRGGEKISPREVDEVLLKHPAIIQAVTFPLSDKILGEEIASAVVLAKDKTITEWELQRYVSEQVASFKVPRKIIFLNEIPKGPTGKIQRKSLATQLKIDPLNPDQQSGDSTYQEPRNKFESQLLEIWSKMLRKPDIGINDNYFALGGDSLRAEEIVTEIQLRFGLKNIPIVIFLHAPTVAKMATLLSSEVTVDNQTLVLLQPGGEETPLFLIHACGGEVLFLGKLAYHLGRKRPIYAFRAPYRTEGKMPVNVFEEYAKRYLIDLKQKQPRGPYIIGGAGVGGLIALEMAHRMPDERTIIILMDTVNPKSGYNGLAGVERGSSMTYLPIIKEYLLGLARARSFNIPQMAVNRFVRRFRRRKLDTPDIFEASKKYTTKQRIGETLIFTSSKKTGLRGPRALNPEGRLKELKNFIGGEVEAHTILGEHLDILEEPGVIPMASLINNYLEKKIGL